MRRVIERLGLTEDLLVTLVFGGMLLGGLLIGGTALYLAPQSPEAAVPAVFEDPQQYAGQSGIHIRGVVRRWVEHPQVLEVVPIAGGMLQPDPPMLVALGPGARDVTVRGQAQEVHFWGTVITSEEDIPPGVTLTPAAQQLLDDGQTFFYAEHQ